MNEVERAGCGLASARSYDCSQLAACGDDVFIGANVEIRRPGLLRVGSHVAIDAGFFCTVDATLGDYIHIGPYVTVIGGQESRLRLSHFTTMGAGSRLVCGSDEFLGEGLVGSCIPAKYRDHVVHSVVSLQMYASLGTNVVVHPGVTIAEGSVVGSCSLVTHDTEPWTVYYGIPARPVRERPREKMIAAARALGYA
jgi:acetyltransferase-like isoleucine patch superfamily enzyme